MGGRTIEEVDKSQLEVTSEPNCCGWLNMSWTMSNVGAGWERELASMFSMAMVKIGVSSTFVAATSFSEVYKNPGSGSVEEA